MSKIMIWVGQFDSEADFEKYMDQSAFRQWWKEYDEDNEEMRCQFCKELGVMSYDEDFLIMKYAQDGKKALLNLIPANTEKITETIDGKSISECNAVICYNCRSGISPKKALNTTSVRYLGTYEFEMNPTGIAGSLAGLEYLIWIGQTDKSKEEFMQYFNQEEYLKELESYESGQTKKRPNPEHRCQFCKDIDIKFYYPEFLKVEILDHLEKPFEMIKRIINNQFVPDWVIDLCVKDEHVSASNCVVCYIPNGFKDKKKNQNIYIKKKSYDDSDVPKKHVNELASYNGLKYLEWFKAEG
ncbi:immunity 22 family protein [Bacteroides fragilis]|nr:immunity 22 family protein [Bacteroides fragilis]